ncbi:MAG: hypothetical protein WA703_04335, partial [Pseudolabrys sp.]
PKYASNRGSAWLSRFLWADLSRIDPRAQRLAHVGHQCLATLALSECGQVSAIDCRTPVNSLLTIAA